MITPLFKSHYSIGKSILTLEKKGSSAINGPSSIIDICLQNKLDNFCLVEDSMGGFLEAYLNAKEVGISLRFGLRLTVCADSSIKDEESLSKQAKYIIFANNRSGYQKLIKIYGFAAKDGFYYEPRTDFNMLKEHWSDEDLTLAIPFYDSFLHKNSLRGSLCLPDFSYCQPVFFIEDNNLPFDTILENLVEDYVKDKYEIVKAKSVFYNNRADFKSFLTFKCINNRTTLSKPELEHMSSDEFCMESWKGQQD